eukprot:scaffold34399_cov54-Cyclotella_meneghiniana.AAC.1
MTGVGTGGSRVAWIGRRQVSRFTFTESNTYKAKFAEIDLPNLSVAPEVGPLKGVRRGVIRALKELEGARQGFSAVLLAVGGERNIQPQKVSDLSSRKLRFHRFK